ncbi:MAG: hypothetical protein O7C59_08420 [Rickettsia endosymbiont of Ixodes persulcatus]|nr:hypothetical protein [Rickettsia endosymbiont of Ixodes persulcatus]
MREDAGEKKKKKKNKTKQKLYSRIKLLKKVAKIAAEKIGVQPKNHQWRRERESKTQKTREERERH